MELLDGQVLSTVAHTDCISRLDNCPRVVLRISDCMPKKQALQF